MAIKAGPFSQADGPQTINIGSDADMPWHEIAVRLEDDQGNPITSNPAAGTLAGAVVGVGADQPEAFTESLDLTTGDRRWKPFFSFIKDVIVTPTALPANVRYFVTINSTRG